MSEFKFPCPACQEEIVCDESYGGTQFACPVCGQDITAPQAAVAAPAPVPGRGRFQPATRRAERPKPPSGESSVLSILAGISVILGVLGAGGFLALASLPPEVSKFKLSAGVFLMGTGCALTLGACLLILINAFRESVLWGLGSLFVPFVSLVFVIMHWAKNGVLFLVNLGGGLLAVAGIAIMGMTALQGLANMKPGGGGLGGDSASLDEGFASPAAVVEAMKTRTGGDAILVVLPEERPLIATAAFAVAGLQSAFQTDPNKRQQAQQSMKALADKYNLTKNLGDAGSVMTMESEEQSKAAVGRAFADVNIVEFMSDLEAHARQFGSKDASPLDEFGKAVSLEGVRIEGSKASGTLLLSDGSREPAAFAKTERGWFLSILDTADASPGVSVTSQRKRPVPPPAPRASRLTLEQLERNTELTPNDPAAWYELAAKRCAYGQWDFAANDLSKAIVLADAPGAAGFPQFDYREKALEDARFQTLFREKPELRALLARP